MDMLRTVFKACGAMPANLIIALALLGLLCAAAFAVYFSDKKKNKPGADVFSASENSAYLPVLDGMRAVCALLIFFFHDWQQTWLSAKFQIGDFLLNLEPIQRYGYIVIDAFFVLSGFCLFYPTARSMFGECKKSGWKQFYIKRLRRILPAYYLMLLILLFVPALSYTVYNVHDAADVAKHFGLHALFLHIYDPAAGGSVISTAWTLGIEAAFYVVFPFIDYIFRKKPVLVFAGMFVFSQALRLLTASEPRIGMYQMQNPLLYIDIFGAGMLSAYAVVYARHRAKFGRGVNTLFTAVSVMCVIGVYLYTLWMGSARIEGMDAQSYHRLLYRWIPAWLFALFIFAAAYSLKGWQKFLGNKFFVFMSGISYSFYLWHQNIHIALRKAKIPPTAADPVTSDKPAMVIFALLSISISIAAAALSTYLIEKPIVKYGYKGCVQKIIGVFTRGKQSRGTMKK